MEDRARQPAPPRPIPPGYVPIYGTVGDGGRVVEARPIPRPPASPRPALRLVEG